MTTEELVNMDPAAFQAAVENLDAKTCERCARDMFHRLGARANFEEYFADVLDAMLYSGRSGEERLLELYEVAEKHAPRAVPGYGLLGRLTAVTVQMISLSMPSRKGRR